MDGLTAYYVETVRGEQAFLTDLQRELKTRTFRPLPVKERLIPTRDGKRRRLGVPTVKDRVVQAALKLVLEPIFEADFKPCSYGFRPRRRAHDAIAEIHMFCTKGYEWVLEGDIEACFDSIDHGALVARLCRRIADKRIAALVKAFLKAGLLTEAGQPMETITGTPQGGILSPLLANIALSQLDEHFDRAWKAMGQTGSQRYVRRKKGLATYRLVRYADDFVVLVSGTREHAEALLPEIVAVLAPMGLRLSDAKTRITHIDEGFDFLGFRIKRARKQGTEQRFIYTYPSKAALAAVKAKVRALTRGSTHQTLADLLQRLNPLLRGWTNYFRHAVSKASFDYLCAFVWRRVMTWLRHKHRRITWKQLRRRYLNGWWPVAEDVALFDPSSVAIIRYRYRGSRIPTPWTLTQQARKDVRFA